MNSPTPTLSSRTIRVFVSSTFSDMKAERDALQRLVFPKLKQLCLAHGLRFQPVDLRWGVSEESGRHNRTMRVCLRELKRCQESGPKPNFLILLGDRYGWRPLPEAIPADLFERMEAAIRSGGQDSADAAVRPGSHDAKDSAIHSRGQKAAELLRECYRRDDNAVPPAYLLQPRQAPYDDHRWSSEVEPTLLTALSRAASDLDSESRLDEIHLGLSATHQEIVHGALNVENAKEHVHAFFRTIRYPEGETPPEGFVDRVDGRPDDDARPRLEALKEQLASHIGRETNIHPYDLDWRAEGQFTYADLERFCDAALAVLSGVIDRQIQQMTSVPTGEQEEEAHAVFAAERCRNFVGREAPLLTIRDALESGSKPLAVLGAAGSGKSALMAQAVHEARERHPEATVLPRFIGATLASSNLIPLLRGLVAAIRKKYPLPPPQNEEEARRRPRDEDVPAELEPLIAALNEALQRPTPDVPLFLFLDALDQLASADGAHHLRWLPAAVRIVFSAALPAAGVTTGPPTDILRAVEARGEGIDLVVLEKLNPESGALLLDRWMGETSRTLQPAQREAVLRMFAVKGNPLWLRTAATESCRLASWDDPPEFPADTLGLMGEVLARLATELEHGKLLVHRALGYLVSARHGLAEDEMLDLLSLDPEVMQDFHRRFPKSPPVSTLPVAVWAALLGDISGYLAEREAQGAGLLGFYHRSFREAVETACLGEPAARQARHEHLAAYFQAQPRLLALAGHSQEQAPPEPSFSGLPNARKASELPWHLLRAAEEADSERVVAGIWDPALALLCDLLFVETKCRSGLVYELQEDYRLALENLPERQAQLAEEKRRREPIDRWTQEIAEYSRKWSERRDRLAGGEAVTEPEPPLPEPPPSCRIWTPDEIEAECRRIIKNPTRLDQLNAFAGFVRGEYHPLLNHSERAAFVLQHAQSYAPGGLVHEAAATLLPSCPLPVLLRRWPPLARENPKPALVRTLEGHRSGVESVAVTPDGRHAVSGGEFGDCALRVWDLETGQCLRLLQGHRNRVQSVALTADGRRAVSGSTDDTLRVWDLESGQCLRTLEGHGDSVSSVAVTPDGGRAVSGGGHAWGGDCALRVWDLESGQCLRTLDGHSGFVNSVAVTPDGRRAVSGSNDNTLRVWDLESGQCLRTLRSGKVSSLVATPDGRLAVSGSSDNTLRVWDLESGQCLRTLDGHSGFVNSVAVTPDGRRAVSGSNDNTLRVWDLESDQCQRRLQRHSGPVPNVVVTADGRRAVSGSEDGTLGVWELASGQCLRLLQGHSNRVQSVALTPDGRRAVSGSFDDTLRVWDLESGACLLTLKGNEPVVVTPDGRRAISGSVNPFWVFRSNALRVWDLESGRCLRILRGHRDRVEGLAVTPDGRRAVSGGSLTDMTVRVWDLESGQCLRTMQGHTSNVESVAVTPDGRRAVSGSKDRTLRVWDLETGQCLRTLKGVTDSVGSVALTAEGGRIVSHSWHGTLRVWDLENGACLRALKGGSHLVVTPDGRRAVLGGWDKTVRIWDLESGQCLSLFSASAAVSAVALALRGNCICFGTSGGDVLFLDSQGIEPGPIMAPDKSDERYEQVLRNWLASIRHENGEDYDEILAHLQALAAHRKRSGKPGALQAAVAIARGIAALRPENPEFRVLVAELTLRNQFWLACGRWRLARNAAFSVSLALALGALALDRSNRCWWILIAQSILQTRLPSPLAHFAVAVSTCYLCLFLGARLDPSNVLRWAVAGLLAPLSLILAQILDMLRMPVSRRWLRSWPVLRRRLGDAAFFKRRSEC